MRDNRSNTWTWTFDSLGRNLSRSDPDSGSWSFVYDDSGMVTSQTDAKAQFTSFAYDGAGRLTEKRFPASPADDVWLQYSEGRTGFYNVGRLTTTKKGASPVSPTCPCSPSLAVICSDSMSA
jgi:YD repeat-containing protein